MQGKLMQSKRYTGTMQCIAYIDLGHFTVWILICPSHFQASHTHIHCCPQHDLSAQKDTLQLRNVLTLPFSDLGVLKSGFESNKTMNNLDF